ncbi:hypothetical protein TNCT_528001 [Trichonephila clavata]|uniref:Uncharacterized protein n=1 Tax=Trichonephila clavata TaxID=2740835 RepID=A0A8X6LWX4_TRICU|nr:hypothetical protein TNCT_528001 [Trichonephila clavata]
MISRAGAEKTGRDKIHYHRFFSAKPATKEKKKHPTQFMSMCLWQWPEAVDRLQGMTDFFYCSLLLCDVLMFVIFLFFNFPPPQPVCDVR